MKRWPPRATRQLSLGARSPWSPGPVWPSRAAVAARTAGYSGADLMGLADQVVERKLPEALKLGRAVPITTRDVLAVAAQVKPSTRDWFNTARNYVLYANQGGQYDAVRAYLDGR